MKPENEASIALHLGERGLALGTFISEHGKSFLFKDGSTLKPGDINHISNIAEGASGDVSIEFFQGDKKSYKENLTNEGAEHRPELFYGLRLDFTTEETYKKTLFVDPNGKGRLRYTVDSLDDNGEDVMAVEAKEVEKMLKELNLDPKMIKEVIRKENNKNGIENTIEKENKNKNVFSRLKNKIF